MTARILIADDNSSVRMALRQLLDGLQNCEFLEAADGQEAVSKALELRPQVVILDLAMPVMDGLSAAREILRALPATPIFLCTMHWSAHVEMEAQRLGVRAVVSKAHSSILVEAVERLFNSEVSNSSAAARSVPSGVTIGPALVDSPPHAADKAINSARDPQNTPQIRRSG